MAQAETVCTRAHYLGSSSSAGEPQLTVNYRSRIFSAVVMGKAYYGLELVGGNKSHLAPLQTTINKGIRLFTGPDFRLPLDPFWLKLGLDHFSLAHWYHEYACWSVCDQENTHQCHLLSTDNDVFTLNVQGQLVRSSAGSGLVGPNSYTGTVLADTTSQTKDSQATTLALF
ncbi:hypothetical protein BASA81_012061 [Batrachochytrium salamandrivorans]|nr:hypothetical protein BASA81_012061 [Batrachochytrium salamandrivorans]